MNVRKYGSPAAYVPNNKADKRWQKQWKYTEPLNRERPEIKLTKQDILNAIEQLKKRDYIK